MDTRLRHGVCALLTAVMLMTPGCLSPAESALSYRDQVHIGTRRVDVFDLFGPPDVSVPDEMGVMWTYQFGGDARRRIGMIPETIGFIILGVILTGVVIGIIVLMIAAGASGGGGGNIDIPSMPDGTPRYKPVWREAKGADWTSSYAARIRIHLSEGLIDWLSPVEVR